MKRADRPKAPFGVLSERKKLKKRAIKALGTSRVYWIGGVLYWRKSEKGELIQVPGVKNIPGFSKEAVGSKADQKANERFFKERSVPDRRNKWW